MMVCTELIWVSYSLNPPMIGSMVRAVAIIFPAVIAALAILERIVTARTSKAEKRRPTDSTPLEKPDISMRSIADPKSSTPAFSPEKLTRLMADPIFSNPLKAPEKFKLSLSLPMVDRLVWTLDSNCLLSNRISTIR